MGSRSLCSGLLGPCRPPCIDAVSVSRSFVAPARWIGHAYWTDGLLALPLSHEFLRLASERRQFSHPLRGELGVCLTPPDGLIVEFASALAMAELVVAHGEEEQVESGRL